jgi:hypothetical protein
MLVMGRFFYRGLGKNQSLPSTGVYECLLGLSREKGVWLAGGPEASAEAVMDIIRTVCVRRRGRRDNGFNGSADSFDEALFAHLKVDALYVVWYCVVSLCNFRCSFSLFSPHFPNYVQSFASGDCDVWRV